MLDRCQSRSVNIEIPDFCFRLTDWTTRTKRKIFFSHLANRILKITLCEYLVVQLFSTWKNEHIKFLIFGHISCVVSWEKHFFRVNLFPMFRFRALPKKVSQLITKFYGKQASRIRRAYGIMFCALAWIKNPRIKQGDADFSDQQINFVSVLERYKMYHKENLLQLDALIRGFRFKLNLFHRGAVEMSANGNL